MARRLGELKADRKGATAIEYGLILALVVLALMAALHNFADASVGMWNNISNKVTNAGVTA